VNVSVYYRDGHTYLVLNNALNQVDAQAQANSRGGYLAKIGTQAENDAVLGYLQAEAETWGGTYYVAPDGGGAAYVWIGASDAAKEGDWTWRDGTALTFTNWGSGEPDNSSNQDGAAIALWDWPQPAGGRGTVGQWNDIAVTNGLRSLIEFDQLVGSNRADTIPGSKRGDRATGWGGNDLINGNGGSDTIDGGAGADTLHGGSGSDVLYGRAGADTLHGESGKDTFVFDTRLSAGNADIIADYSTRDDTIRLENAVMTKLAAGKLASSAFWKGQKAHDAGDRIIYDGTNGHLYYDADGTGSSKQVLIATLGKHLKMSAAEFYVI